MVGEGQEDAGREPSEGSPSLVDRVRSTIGDPAPADDGPFNRGTLSAWLGDEQPPPPRESPRLPEARPPEEGSRSRPERSRRVLVLSALSLVLALALAGTAALAVVNARRADDWQQRAEQIETRSKIINDLLIERSRDTNARTRALNAAAAKLRSTRRALVRSEADVRDLVRRQAELANEKAQAEDASR
jgi:GAF domain-containing protein